METITDFIEDRDDIPGTDSAGGNPIAGASTPGKVGEDPIDDRYFQARQEGQRRNRLRIERLAHSRGLARMADDLNEEGARAKRVQASPPVDVRDVYGDDNDTEIDDERGPVEEAAHAAISSGAWFWNAVPLPMKVVLIAYTSGATRVVVASSLMSARSCRA